VWRLLPRGRRRAGRTDRDGSGQQHGRRGQRWWLAPGARGASSAGGRRPSAPAGGGGRCRIPDGVSLAAAPLPPRGASPLVMVREGFCFFFFFSPSCCWFVTRVWEHSLLGHARDRLERRVCDSGERHFK
jgi:hypothetical protein